MDSGNETSSEEEEHLKSKYASRQIFSADALWSNYANARALAFQYALALNKSLPTKWAVEKQAGTEWMRCFMKRNPKLSYRKPENISIARTSSFNSQNVKMFFDNYANVQRKEKFSPDRIVNMDETGITTVLQAPKVICKSGLKQVGQCVSAERSTLVTFCGIITVVGTAIPPVYIFPRVRMKDAYLFGAVPGAVAFASKSGWMTSEIFVQVLEHIKKHMHNMHISCDNKVLLIADNHETHISLNAINLMQPLDIGVYGLLKNRCKSSFNDDILGHPGKAINIYNVAQLTAQPYLLPFTPFNITKAFTKSGIWPINSLAFTDSDFTGVLQYEVDTHEPTSSQSPEETNIATTSLHLNASVDSSKINIISNLVVVPSKNKDINVKEFIAGLLSLDNVLDKVTDASTNLNKKTFLSPTDIRPYPKLTVKPNKKSRKQGRSRIYTNTPEKKKLN
ncbi:hypothetical protein NQ314_000310 [Rhamnusium bicolor]|uniref:DDE-1 domain-containing protein n=1 Tax=Rhamnusium bicolor TaxID=1586634 RepID=A0AAV8ZW71_9CUCU|nr:hypothetical protein NQ314_000310 [Rhamnusium bicolor]